MKPVIIIAIGVILVILATLDDNVGFITEVIDPNLVQYSEGGITPQIIIDLAFWIIGTVLIVMGIKVRIKKNKLEKQIRKNKIQKLKDRVDELEKDKEKED